MSRQIAASSGSSLMRVFLIRSSFLRFFLSAGWQLPWRLFRLYSTCVHHCVDGTMERTFQICVHHAGHITPDMPVHPYAAGAGLNGPPGT